MRAEVLLRSNVAVNRLEMEIHTFIELVTLQCGDKITWCCNGDSAGDSQHPAAKIVGRFRREQRGAA
jgi:phosphoheptose isomerase